MTQTSGTRGMARSTSPWVKVSDRAAQFIITAGGLAVLAAMLGICLFLFDSAAPLLRGGDLAEPATDAAEIAAPPVAALRLDAGPGRVVAMTTDARIATIDVDAGRITAERSLIEADRTATAHAFDPSGMGVFALDDGSLFARSFGYVQRPLDEATLPARLTALPVEAKAILAPEERATIEAALRLSAGTLGDDAYARRDADGVLRVWDLELGEPVSAEVAPGETITLIDARGIGDRRWSFVAALESGEIVVGSVRQAGGLMGASGRLRVSTDRFTPLAPSDAKPLGVFATADGSDALVVWPDGTVQRYTADRPDADGWVLGDAASLPDGAHATVARIAIGARTLLVGDDRGSVHRLMVVPEPAAIRGDGRRLVVANSLAIGLSPVSAIGIQGRDRTVAVALADGTAALISPTPGSILATARGLTESPPTAVGLAQSLDRLAILSADGRISVHAAEVGHPDAGLGGLFGRVWYEGYAGPRFIYQSTGAPGAEPKLSLVPLIFGTLKATVVAMVIAAPLGVLAAIYTSQFLHPKLRRIVKPGIELMASLPSVVLGFIAAVLIAPLVADWLPAIIVAAAVIPLCVVVAAHAWRFVPARFARRVPSLGHLALVMTVMAAGAGVSLAVGPAIESGLFSPNDDERLLMAGVAEPVPHTERPTWLPAHRTPTRADEIRLRDSGLYVRGGEVVRVPDITEEEAAELVQPGLEDGSIRRWLDGEFGGPWPGWFLLMVPPALLVVVGGDIKAGRLWAAMGAEGATLNAEFVELLRLTVRVLATLALAATTAGILVGLGLDPRDSLLGAFSQRNTVVVGIAMGFAVIPIIYTISEDAMTSVPAGLRAASLGAGATAWQTAVRVVLPVAGSGIFSAIMVGLGRAVGETMIVLMATGNTPEISANIFSGFRTLAANIAVELPEAPRGGTHYRVLFLCGLVLFAMTLVINTTAELVRQRVRKRNAAL